MAMPRSDKIWFNGEMVDWDDVPDFPTPEIEGENKWVMPEPFFDQLPGVMDAVAPLPGEEALYASIRQVLAVAAKDPEVKKALVEAAVNGETRFFCGTDSAPHSLDAKQSACGCAGIYSAHSALELYAEAFDELADFSHFESFMSLNGAQFYGLPPNRGSVTLRRQPWTVPDSLPYPESCLIPFRAGETINWKLVPND